jgi:hypothetical protein
MLLQSRFGPRQNINHRRADGTFEFFWEVVVKTEAY